MKLPKTSIKITNTIIIKDSKGNTSGYHEVIIKVGKQWRRLFFKTEKTGTKES